MAFRPRFRRRTFRRRTNRARPRRTFRRSYYRGRRTRRPNTTKRIRNIAARKCKDKMLGLPYTLDDPPAPANPGEATTLTGNSTWGIIWNASGRSIGRLNPTGQALFPLEADRGKSRVYFRGVAEKMSMETNSNAAWIHRRTVFLDGGETIRTHMPPDTASTLTGSLGYVRPLYTVLNTAAASEPGATAWHEISDQIYDGQHNVDWSNLITARMDSQKVKVLYDKTRRISSGNDRGTWKINKYWHPVNRTIIYDDDQDGNEINTAPWSSGSRQSAGDVIVMDIFSCADGEEADEIRVGVESTVYWHEGSGY
ncbi:capsid protein [Chicken genomovirus mg8_401]|uniref:Capsid protein n=1 Tax=Chicken genomovirus mg8_401 TaxID=2720952 RepID=A0A6G9W2P3_9VIRU|nr:capsid protein [Chicken genomovirus mg8_401]QIR82254.1 capsid protein [Chicken genomovirus mg8_401]